MKSTKSKAVDGQRHLPVTAPPQCTLLSRKVDAIAISSSNLRTSSGLDRNDENPSVSVSKEIEIADTQEPQFLRLHQNPTDEFDVVSDLRTATAELQK
jgi:hypothetical protein